VVICQTKHCEIQLSLSDNVRFCDILSGLKPILSRGFWSLRSMDTLVREFLAGNNNSFGERSNRSRYHNSPLSRVRPAKGGACLTYKHFLAQDSQYQ
jgi:hypothetical protein